MTTIRIGRAADNEIVLADDLRVSAHHAELQSNEHGVSELVDLGSRNGTFVNHEPVKRRRLSDGDVVTVGAHLFKFEGGRLEEETSLQPSFEAVALCVDLAHGHPILDHVSFHLEPSTLLAVVGPSGAGKTTLLNALTGFRPADTGTVFYGGRDLYEAYQDIRFRMGYVPQGDVLHEQLTVQQALEFAADLRFSEDVDRATRDGRVAEVIEEMDLSEHKDTRVSDLSGGQRKRVNVGLELLTQPSLLFLDEPTSGLDPGNERQMMELLRSLAADGRVVIVVTHSAQSLDLCDRVLFLAPGGRLAYFGPPKEALEFFGGRGGEGAYAAIFNALEESNEIDWKQKFESSPQYDEYVRSSMAEADAVREREARQPLPPPPPHSFLRQLRILVRRQLALVLAEPKTFAVLLLQAPALGLLYFTAFGARALTPLHGDDATLIVWLLAVGATWLGVANSIREIVKELPIYRRERSVGLAIGPYLTAKAVFFGALTTVQAVALVWIALLHQRVPPADPNGFVKALTPIRTPVQPVLGNFDRGSFFASQWTELFVAIALTGIAGVALGLFLSTLVKTSNQALAILPLVLAVQIVLSLPLFSGTVTHALSNGISAKWGTDAAASTVSLNVLRIPLQLATVQGKQDVSYDLATLNHAENPGTPAPTYQPPKEKDVVKALRGDGRWDHRPGTWWTSATLLVALTGVFFAGAWVMLRRRDLRVLAERTTARAAAPARQTLKPHSPLFTPRHVVAIVVVGVLLTAAVAAASRRTTHHGGTPYPDAAESRLLAFVPEDTAASCARKTSGVPDHASAAILCRAARDPDHDVVVSYYLFAGTDILTGWYADEVRRSGLGPNRGSCTPQDLDGEVPYTSGSTSPGRVPCFGQAEPRMEWTNVPDLMGADAYDVAGDAGAVLHQWQCCLVR